jgi:hypothetical protein
MADEPQVIRGIDWKATFPFVSLFRGFRVAIHPSKLILALLALMLIFFGGKLLDAIWPASYSAVPNELGLYGESYLNVTPSAEFDRTRADTRARLEAEHKARLAMIPQAYTNRKDLADYENYLHEMLVTRVKDINETYDRRVKDINDTYNKRPDAERNDAAVKNTRDRDLDRAKLDRDNDINSAYERIATETEEARQVKGVGLFQTFADHELGMLNQMVAGVRAGNWLGNGGVVDAIRSFFVFAPMWAMRFHWFFFTIFFLYFLAIWSIFGGAIARIAAVHVARDEKISIRQALRFSTNKFLSFLSAPIIPMLIVLAVGLVIAVGGLLINIPFIGPIVVGAFFFLALVAGFVMTLVLLGTGGGFNLMYPTIAVEGSDSFDAISRSFSYLYARPWRMAFYTAVSILYGSICYLFVRYFLYLMLALTHKFVGLFVLRSAYSSAPLWNVIWPSPTTEGRFVYDINYLALGPGEKFGALLIAIWVYLAIGLLGAFAVSFYFSANTIIYLLMRHEVDATELDDVYLEQTDDEFAETGPATTTTVVASTTVIETPAQPPAPLSEQTAENPQPSPPSEGSSGESQPT